MDKKELQVRVINVDACAAFGQCHEQTYNKPIKYALFNAIEAEANAGHVVVPVSGIQVCAAAREVLLMTVSAPSMALYALASFLLRRRRRRHCDMSAGIWEGILFSSKLLFCFSWLVLEVVAAMRRISVID